MSFSLRATLPVFVLALAAAPLTACGGPQAAASTPSPSVDPSASPTPAGTATSTAPQPSGTSIASDAPPTRAECDAFMDVVARTTVVRAAIQREPATAAKAADWAARVSEIAESANKLAIANDDLAIEKANLIGRLTDLATDLQKLEASEKTRDPVKTAAAHKHVLATSEQVEVLTREPAARCSGDPKLLQATPGRLAASKVQAVMQAHFDDFTKCYVDGLKRDPKLAGRIAIRFGISPAGAVSDARIVAPTDPIPPDAIAPPSTSTLPALTDAQVLSCAIAATNKLQFPKPDGGAVTVVYPFTFTRTP
ncbi:MAG: AgmX/PglI C-terminal domain-containing protein [Polyangiaceae bacterium]